MKKLLPIALFVTICISACSKVVSVNASADDGTVASIDADSFEFPPEEEMDEYLAPYMNVLTDIKNTYGVIISFPTKEQKENLYLKCLGMDTDEFRRRMLAAIGENDGEFYNLPHSSNLLEDLGAAYTREFTNFVVDEFSFLN